MSEDTKCWACKKVVTERARDYHRFFLTGLLQKAGLAMCANCYGSFVCYGRNAPGLTEYGRVPLADAGIVSIHPYPAAWVFQLTASDAPNGELLYRMAFPTQRVTWALSIPGWVFVVSHV